MFFVPHTVWLENALTCEVLTYMVPGNPFACTDGTKSEVTTTYLAVELLAILEQSWQTSNLTPIKDLVLSNGELVDELVPSYDVTLGNQA